MRLSIAIFVLLFCGNVFALDMSGNWCSFGENGKVFDDFNQLIKIEKNGDYKYIHASLNDRDSRTKQSGYISIGASSITMEPSISRLGALVDFSLKGIEGDRKLALEFVNGDMNFKACPGKWAKRLDQIFQ